jgi:SulP family sulfate permease
MWWVIILVWYWLINFKEINKILTANKSEASVLLVTFFSTLFLELEFAIYLWIILSLLLFLNRTSTPDIITLVQNYNKEKKRKELIWARKIIPWKVNQLKCPQLEIIRIDMSVYFWSVDHIQNKLNDITESRWIKNILIVAKSINFIDMTGAHMLEKENEKLKNMWWWLYITWMKTKVFIELSSIWFIDIFWRENIFDSTKEAIRTIYENKIDKKLCKNCENKIFEECWNKVGEVDYRTIIKHDLWKKGFLSKILGRVKNMITKK